MCPHADDFYNTIKFNTVLCDMLLIDLINDAMLNIDASGEKTAEVSNKCLVPGRILKRIFPDDINKSFRFSIKTGRLQILDIFYCLPIVNNLIAHQSTSSSEMHSSTGVAFPLSRDSAMPGTEFR